MSVTTCLKPLIDAYNKDVLINYDPFFTMELNRQVRNAQVGGDIPDSFYNGVDSAVFLENIDALMAARQNVFLVLGAGPVGLQLSNALCLGYPDSIVLLYDSRAKTAGPPHVRPDYGRLRTLGGLGGRTIKEVEEERFGILMQSSHIHGNVYTLYHPNLRVENLIRRYSSIKFLFNCTGGRTRSLLNSITKKLVIGRSLAEDIDGDNEAESAVRLNRRYTNKKPRTSITRIASDGDGNTYKLTMDGKLLTYNVEQDETFIKMSTEFIITITQGELSIDIWASEFPQILIDNPAITGTYEETITFVNALYDNGYVINPPDRQVTLAKFELFNHAGRFTASSFKAGLKLSRRKLCQLHHIGPNYVIKFDLGDSMGSVPVASGNNIAVGTKVLNRNVLPTVARMLECITNHPDALPGVQDLLG
jgi:hypothetical protein